MPATLDPPAAPAAPVTPAADRTAIPATDYVKPSAVPVEPPKKGSRMETLYKDLEKKAKPASGEETTPAAPTKPADKPDQRPGSDTTTTTDAPEVTTDQPATPTSEAGDKGKKTTLGQVLDRYKARCAQLEKDLVDTKASITPEADRKILTERAQKAETRATDLENQMRLIRYESSQEFQEKYEEPCKKGWAYCLQEMEGVPVIDENTGMERPMTVKDMLDLTQLDMADARKLAEAKFGPFANDALTQRKELKKLLQTRAEAIHKAKEEGALREQQHREMTTRQAEEHAKFIKSTWDKVNAEALENPEFGTYFTRREGDEDWNQRLAKGFQLVDTAFSTNVGDPKLTPDQRAAVIRRHAAVRNRAAGWGALKHENGKLKAQIAALENDLKKFKSSTPTAGGTTTPASDPTLKGMDRVRADLAKYAK